MRTWTFAEVRPPGDGPWVEEPDKAQWVDEATGLDCLIVRNPRAGHLCGYVGVPPGHPWHGVSRHEIIVVVHDCLSFSDFCQEGAENSPSVCHVPEPGRPEKVWWLGFAAAGFMDAQPTAEAVLATIGITDLGPVYYRTFDYVRDEVASLAAQAASAMSASISSG